MQALAFWKAVTMDRSDLLDRLIDLLRGQHIPFCVIGGQGVNAYADPLVSLDLDLVVATERIAGLEGLLGRDFKVEGFAHSLNVSAPGSDLRVQFQTDPRYAPFLDHATTREVLGLSLPVARIEDVLRGKVWAAQDPQRRRSKRQKDLADIARLLEVDPQLRSLVPEDLLSKLV